MFGICRHSFLKTVFCRKELRWKTKFSTKSKKLDVVKIWHGITLGEIRAAVNLSENQVNEALSKAKIKRIESIEDAMLLLKLLQRRYDVIASPETKRHDSSIDILSMIEASRSCTGSNFLRRPAVVTIMGHVDHGKTTLLDSLRHSELVKNEFGGITQHIGAFVVTLEGEKVTILDTPGHAAFAAMRKRGTTVTDIVVLVVAADDGVMPQTIESINYAKAASVPIIVARSKIDKVKDLNGSLQRIKSGLFAHGLVLEEDGGDTQAINISAPRGEGLIELKEAILALAEMMQLRSPYDGGVEGTVIESSVHVHRGRLATILVRSGTLRKGDVIVAGQQNIAFAKIRAMFDEWGNILEKVTPGLPVQVIGWRNNVLPAAGDVVIQVQNEQQAGQIFAAASNICKQKKAEDDHVAYLLRSKTERAIYKAELEAKRAAGIKRKATGPRQKEMIADPDEDKKINIILKADVNGSLEVLLNVLESYPNETQEVKLNIIHSGVGSITENDVEFASCFKNTFVYGFNVSTLPNALSIAKEMSIPVFNFKVIYKLIDSVKSEISRRLPQRDIEEVIGEAVVIKEFLITEKNKKVKVAGCRCVNGSLKKDFFFKLKRGDNIMKDRMELESMRHLKDEVSVIKKDMECGLKFNTGSQDDVHFQQTDTIICYKVKKVDQISNWNPKGF